MNIVFDIGNVICEWNPQKLVNKVFRDKDERDCALKNIIGHNDWLMLDKGTISLKVAIQKAINRCQISSEKITNLFDETPKSLVPFPETVTLIKELHRKGFSLYVLSNMHNYAFEYLFSKYDFWQLFSGIVISSHIKSIKPEPEIFDHLIKEYNLRPDETLFLDDMAVNVEAAGKKKINTILVNNVSQIKTEIYKRVKI